MLAFVIVGLIALAITMASIPPTVHIARARGLLDRPDCSRRIHARPVPRLGGIPVWLGVASGLVGWALIARPTGQSISVPTWAPGALVGLTMMICTGLIDDIRDVRPRTKLLAQVVAALVVVAAGFRIDQVTISAGTSLSLGWLGAPLTVLWIVAVTNAVNLIDGLDGLAGGITIVTVGALMVSAVLGGSLHVMPVLAALMGGMLGFLRYNRSPARIFLGDVGSLSIGFALALLSIAGARQGGEEGPVGIVVAGFVLAFPVLDTTIAMLRRWLRAVPLSGADGRHVHHQLVGLGLTHHRASALICLFAAGMALLGITITYAPPALTIAISLVGLAAWTLLVIHGTRWLQYHEFQEAQASFTSGLRRARQVVRDRILARDLEARIRAAETVADIRRLFEQNRMSLGFDVLALCSASDVRSRVDAALAITDQRPRLTFPVTGRGNAMEDAMLIVASWRRGTRQPPLYAERVIRILVPAVEEALERINAPARDATTAARSVTTMLGKLPFGGASDYPEEQAPVAQERKVARAAVR